MHVSDYDMPDLSQDAQFSGSARVRDLHVLKFPNQRVGRRGDSPGDLAQCSRGGSTVDSQLLRKHKDISGCCRGKGCGVADPKA
jgi:hypothetical protein